MNARAEVEYEPEPYPGPIILFHGAGLYDDPELGWGGLAEEIETLEVPGPHRGNRDSMAEPNVGFIAERLQEHLADVHDHSPVPV